MTLPAALAGLVIRNVFRDSKDRLWIGTDGQGVARARRHELVERYTMKDGLVNDFVRAFCEDREGGIWIGTDGGLSYWRDGTLPQLHGGGRPRSTAASAACCSIATSSLWVATERGLSRFRSGAFVSDPLLERLRGHEGLGAARGLRRRTVDRDAGRRALPV